MISATLDLGTNTVLLLIADITNGKLKVLRDEARITRLGEGLHESPHFRPQAQERVLKVLREYKSLCDKAGVEKITAVGTAAFRKAKNASELIDRVELELGFRIQIISGEEEARLSYLSVTTDFQNYPNLVALDIGGGSTEVISNQGGVSYDLGAVVLTESIVKQDPISDDEFRQMQDSINQKLENLNNPFPGPVTLAGLAGSVTTLSAIKQKLNVWDGARVQGSVLALEDLQKMIEIFRTTTVEEKKKIPGMVRGREDTILAGTLILQKIMEKLGVEQVIVSDRGLRFGVLYEI